MLASALATGLPSSGATRPAALQQGHAAPQELRYQPAQCTPAPCGPAPSPCGPSHLRFLTCALRLRQTAVPAAQWIQRAASAHGC